MHLLTQWWVLYFLSVSANLTFLEKMIINWTKSKKGKRIRGAAQSFTIWFFRFFITLFWRDKKGKVDPKQFMFESLRDETIGKLPGEINGQQFIIQNCQVVFHNKKK